MSAIASSEFPRPPQLFEARQMVTNDPEGITFWNGLAWNPPVGHAWIWQHTLRCRALAGDYVAEARGQIPPAVSATLRGTESA